MKGGDHDDNNGEYNYEHAEQFLVVKDGLGCLLLTHAHSRRGHIVWHQERLGPIKVFQVEIGLFKSVQHLHLIHIQLIVNLALKMTIFALALAVFIANITVFFTTVTEALGAAETERAAA